MADLIPYPGHQDPPPPPGLFFTTSESVLVKWETCFFVLGLYESLKTIIICAVSPQSCSDVCIMSRANALRKLISHWPGQLGGQEADTTWPRIFLYSLRAGHVSQCAARSPWHQEYADLGTPSLAPCTSTGGLYPLSLGMGARTRCTAQDFVPLHHSLTSVQGAI